MLGCSGQNPKQEVKLKSVKRMQALLAAISQRLVTLFQQDGAKLSKDSTQVNLLECLDTSDFFRSALSQRESDE